MQIVLVKCCDCQLMNLCARKASIALVVVDVTVTALTFYASISVRANKTLFEMHENKNEDIRPLNKLSLRYNSVHLENRKSFVSSDAARQVARRHQLYFSRVENLLVHCG